MKYREIIYVDNDLALDNRDRAVIYWANYLRRESRVLDVLVATARFISFSNNKVVFGKKEFNLQARDGYNNELYSF